MQPILQAILLGVIQGLSEFIPISSSGHLVLAEKLLGMDVGSLLFDVTLHTGTLLALVIYFRRDIASLIHSLFNDPRDQLLRFLLIGTLPAVIVGYFLETLAASSLRNSVLVAVNLIWVAFLMIGVEKITTSRKIRQVNTKDSLIIGTAQALALIPGISRSGITIVAGMSQHFKRSDAARLSFLLALPITFGAILKLLIGDGLAEVGSQPGVFIAGVSSAAISGYLAIKFLLRFLASHKLNTFAYYRILLGLFMLAIALF